MEVELAFVLAVASFLNPSDLTEKRIPVERATAPTINTTKMNASNERLRLLTMVFNDICVKYTILSYIITNDRYPISTRVLMNLEWFATTIDFILSCKSFAF